jgi:tetratricopeptide (TPR) repeat protein
MRHNKRQTPRLTPGREPKIILRHGVVSLLLLLIGLVIVYSNSFNCEWHLDDFDNIVENRNVHLERLSWDGLQRSFYGFAPTGGYLKRPLAYFSFALNYYFGQLEVTGYHVVNLAIHYVAAVMLYLLLRTTLALPAAGAHRGVEGHAMALLGAFLWALHPIQVTAVTYVVQRMASLAALFSIIALYAYVKGRLTPSRGPQRLYFGTCIVAAVLAFLSKENAIMLPISIAVYELILLRSSHGVNLRLKHGVMAAVLLIVLVLIALVYVDLSIVFNGYATRPFTLFERLLTQPRVIFYYLSLLGYPTSSRFALLHDVDISTSLINPPITLPAILGIGALLYAAIYMRRRWSLVSFAVLFYAINHVVESSVLPLELVFEHRNYLPSTFLAVLPVMGLARLLRSDRFANRIKYFAMGATVLILVAMGHTTYMRNDVFQNELTLWGDNVQKTPHLHRPLNNYGRALILAGYPEAGVSYLKQAVDAKGVARINQHFISHFNLGLYYLAENALEQAQQHFQHALQLRPGYARSYNQMALIHLYLEQLERAQQYLDHALTLEPDRLEFRYTVSMLHLKHGRPLEALAEARRVQQIDTADANALYLIAEAHRLDGKLERATEFFSAYRVRHPNQLAPYLALVELYYLQSDWISLAETAQAFWHRIDASQLSFVLQTYQTQFNFLPASRLMRIVQGLQRALEVELLTVGGAQEALSEAADNLNKFLNK